MQFNEYNIICTYIHTHGIQYNTYISTHTCVEYTYTYAHIYISDMHTYNICTHIYDYNYSIYLFRSILIRHSAKSALRPNRHSMDPMLSRVGIHPIPHSTDT